jgi:predicted transcriptional regulator
VGREEAGRSAFGRLVDTVFAGSAEALVSHFVRDRRLTKAELERIRAVLDERIESGDRASPVAKRRRS